MERKVEREEKTKGKREKTVVRDRQFPNMKEEERQAPHMQLQAAAIYPISRVFRLV